MLHFLGIGGVGMSALAQAYLDLGYAVSGCDRAFDKGENLGVRDVLAGEGAHIVREEILPADVSRIVVSTAIESTHPALVAAKERGLEIVHRAKALAEAVAGKKLVAVTGTCGKSSVTAMLGHILAELGLDPMVVNGAAVAGWDASSRRIASCRKGSGGIAVIEADESDKSLVAYSPWAVVVTNASADHYGVEEMNRVFDAFIASAAGGPVVDGRNGATVPDEAIPRKFKGYNRENARLAAAMALAIAPEAGVEKVAAALATFRGVARRLEAVGADVFDDYAHNTEKLRAMLELMQSEYAAGVTVVWRPHGYAPLRHMMADLAKMFGDTLRGQDALVLLPVYDAGGTAERTVSSAMLQEAIFEVEPGARVVLAADLEEARREALLHALDGCAVVVCGARDPALPGLARSIAQGRSQ